MACKHGDKPIITYKFGDGGDRRYQSVLSPIEVITKSKPVPASENYKEEGFQVNYRSSQCSLTFCSPVIRDYYTFYQGNTLHVQHVECDGSLSGLFGLNTGDLNITINTSKKCPGLPQNQRCSIQVVHNGQLLFADQGDCPVSYSIQCGNCPEGTCECASSIYPGYCCLDCAATAASIRAITNELRGKNA